MRFQRFTSHNGFSILELTLALGFILLFSAAILEEFYRSIQGNFLIRLTQGNRGSLQTVYHELSSHAHRATDVTWDPNAALLTFIEANRSVSYQVQNNRLMKNKGNGWFPLPWAENIQAFSPTILQNNNGKFLVLNLDLQAGEALLHAKAGFAIRNQI